MSPLGPKKKTEPRGRNNKWITNTGLIVGVDERFCDMTNSFPTDRKKSKNRGCIGFGHGATIRDVEKLERILKGR